MQVEREILNAIGLGISQVQIEHSAATVEPQEKEKASVSIYDFGKYLSENEPPQQLNKK